MSWDLEIEKEGVDRERKLRRSRKTVTELEIKRDIDKDETKIRPLSQHSTLAIGRA